ncbi:MAG TPA: hypothetical protein VL358_03900 [Caulobacteraceae bacterium]|jgi:hypothetical protein|nr:hypothetical protein [Caulobacteraceae bacterium]
MGQLERLRVTPTRFWKERAQFSNFDPPAPFHVRLDSHILHVWGGSVIEPGHPYDGRPVYLSQRRPDWTGEVDVEISPSDPQHYRSGYGSLDRRPDAPSPGGATVAPAGGLLPLPHQRLLSHWAALSYPRVVTHGEREVASLEAHYGLGTPTDFRTYLLHACSTLDDGGEMDDCNAWWGLERIRPVVEECDDQSPMTLTADTRKTLIFADHMIWCWAWAICCDGGRNHGRVMVIGPDRWVADSFAEFIDRYVTDQPSLYP